MKTIIILFLVMILSLVITPSSFIANAQQQNQDVIQWYRADFPPVTIPKGDHADEGFFDKTMTFLIERLPEYEHQFNIANFKRIMMELKKNNHLCCPSLYKTPEREPFVAFSVPAMIVLPNGIITTKHNLNRFTPHLDAEGKISLESLLKDPNITLGISSGRLYSGGIDQILHQFDGQDNLLVRSGEDVFEGLMNMMYMGRVDCLLGYPVEAMYFMKESSKEIDFTYFPIKESSLPITVGYIGCPNNKWGKNIISKIDKIVKKHREKEFINYYGEWLDETTRELYQNMAHQYFSTLPQ